MRNIINAKAPGSHEGLYTLDIGGTSATTVAVALTNLNGVEKTLINQVGGPVSLDEHGNIPKNFLPKGLKQKPTVSGPATLPPATQGVYTITNYDSKRTYDLTLQVIGAGAVYRNDNQVIFTTPDASIVGTGGMYGFKLNGFNFPVMVNLANPVLPTPSILTPSQGLVINNNKFTVSYLIAPGNYAGTAFSPLFVDYQLATDSQFNNIFDYGVDVPVTGSSFVVEDMPQSTDCYLRIRQRDNNFGHSEWSAVRKFNSGTYSEALRSRIPLIQYPIYSDLGILPTDRLQTSPFVAINLDDKHVETEWHLDGLSSLSKTFLTSGQIFRIFNYLESGRTLELKARHRGSLSGWSEWSQPVIFTMIHPYKAEPVLKSVSQATFYAGEYTVANDSVVEIDPLDSLWPSEITLGVAWEVQKVGSTTVTVVNAYGQSMSVIVSVLLAGQSSGVYYIRPRILTNYSSVKVTTAFRLRKL
jgi:hypothetical protein